MKRESQVVDLTIYDCNFEAIREDERYIFLGDCQYEKYDESTSYENGDYMVRFKDCGDSLVKDLIKESKNQPKAGFDAKCYCSSGEYGSGDFIGYRRVKNGELLYRSHINTDVVVRCIADDKMLTDDQRQFFINEAAIDCETITEFPDEVFYNSQSKKPQIDCTSYITYYTDLIHELDANLKLYEENSDEHLELISDFLITVYDYNYCWHLCLMLRELISDEHKELLIPYVLEYARDLGITAPVYTAIVYDESFPYEI